MDSRLRGNDGDGMVDAGHGGGVRLGSRLRGNDGVEWSLQGVAVA